MPRTASINIRTEPQTKSNAEALFGSFGLSLSDAINVFLNMSIAEGGFPFEIKQPRYNKETEAAIQEARDIMSGKIKVRTYSSAKELFDELDAEDE
ncbi:MAG: type II toxin-antitoxin system RelB/DinJ family antitoxin [Mogibacterium sp.]|nr:type II toxin-antitoxin system RelB/DinJ family antitoxin [Mogibacterium sp.]MBR0380306.1 type II toxin-antitoxin system RelB/DinJ family antitoxin [Mogibacterium sp.]